MVDVDRLLEVAYRLPLGSLIHSQRQSLQMMKFVGISGGIRCDIMSRGKRMHDIVDTAVAAGSFKTLVAAVGAAGLVETLKGVGPFTVFAPTDDAFAKLPAGTVESLILPENKDKLVGILTHHVVAGKVLAADVVKLNSATTVAGTSVTIAVNEGTVTIGDASVVTADVLCTNGVIHIVDSVILPV